MPEGGTPPAGTDADEGALRDANLPVESQAALLPLQCAYIEAGWCEGIDAGCPKASTCSGSCVDMLTDPSNCGACGRACTGATSACAGGACLSAPTTLAFGQDAPMWLGVYAGRVYWMNIGATPKSWGNGAIMSVPTTGGTPAMLASANLPSTGSIPSSGHPGGIAVDASGVYWATNFPDGQVLMVPLTGGTPIVLASGQGYPHGITVDATTVYWGNMDAVMKVPKQGGTPVTLVSRVREVGTVTVDAANVYWSDSSYPGSVNKMPIAGGPSIPIATATPFAISLALSGSQLCWNLAGGCTGAMCAPIDGCPTALPTLGGGYLTADDTSVYGWTSHYELARVPLDGSSSTILAADRGAVWTVVDDANVYWTNFEAGTIMSVPKSR